VKPYTRYCREEESTSPVMYDPVAMVLSSKPRTGDYTEEKLSVMSSECRDKLIKNSAGNQSKMFTRIAREALKTEFKTCLNSWKAKFDRGKQK
jgi:hypothetical protein